MLLASLRLLFLILRLPPVLLLLLPQHDSKGVAVGRPPDERLALRCRMEVALIGDDCPVRGV